ncbi:MAG: hypothetical protein QOJ75_319 [Chloroflexota bacterium]|nr:hypothetical protein [Chloroflexota bacterium]
MNPDEIRAVVAADRDPIVAMMTRAFHDDPGAMIVEPEESLRDAAMNALFHQFVTASLTEATATHVTGSPAGGVAFWYGPAAYGPSPAGLMAAATAPGAPALTEVALNRFIPMAAKLEALHDRLMAGQSHLRCTFLAVEPAVQGHGVGGRLLAAGSAIADARGLPVYLETFTPANVRFYERHGYRVIEAFRVPSTAYSVCAMRRG